MFDRRANFIKIIYALSFLFILSSFIPTSFFGGINYITVTSLFLIWVFFLRYIIIYPFQNFSFFIFFLIVYGLFTILRNDYSILEFKRILKDYNNVYVYLLTPIVLAFGPIIEPAVHSQVLIKVLKYTCWLILLTFFFSYDEFGKAFENSFFFLASFGFMYAIFCEKRQFWIWIFSLIFFILTYKVFVEWGRRGRSIHLISTLFFIFLEYIRSVKFNQIRARKFILMAILIASIVPFFFIDDAYALQRGINIEAFNESREYVFTNFYSSFTGVNSIIFGSGLNGRVFRDLNDIYYSNNVENGWLTIVFQAGLIYAIPLFIFFLTTALKGLKSKSIIHRISGYLIILFTVDMFASDFAGLSPSYLFVLFSSVSILKNDKYNFIRK